MERVVHTAVLLMMQNCGCVSIIHRLETPCIILMHIFSRKKIEMFDDHLVHLSETRLEKFGVKNCLPNHIPVHNADWFKCWFWLLVGLFQCWLVESVLSFNSDTFFKMPCSHFSRKPVTFGLAYSCEDVLSGEIWWWYYCWRREVLKQLKKILQ